MPDNSLYTGFEVKQGTEYGIVGNVIVFKFKNAEKTYHQIHPMTNPTYASELTQRIGQICFCARKHEDCTRYEFPEDENGLAGWLI